MSANIKTRLGVMEMEAGNFEKARSLVAEAVGDYTFDLTLEWQQFEDFKAENDDLLADLDDEYTSAINSAQDAKFNELTIAEDNATFNGDLMLKYNQYGANITFDDTREEAMRKASAVAGRGTGTGTAPEEKISRLTAIGNALDTSRGTDGYVDPNTYMEQRFSSELSANEFDDKFSYLLNPGDKERFGVTETEKINKNEMESTVWQWLSTEEASSLSDGEKAQQIRAFGLNPEDFNIYE